MRCEVLLLALDIALPTAKATRWRTAASATTESRATEASSATRWKVPSEATATARATETSSGRHITPWTRWRCSRSSGVCGNRNGGGSRASGRSHGT
jgi:hypothetical protein